MQNDKNSAENMSSVAQLNKTEQAAMMPNKDMHEEAMPEFANSDITTDFDTNADSDINTDYEAALTQIGNELKKAYKNKEGFDQAQQDADQALKDNKIVLNKRFVLESTLGAGGMGTVYKAQDLRKVEASDTNPYVAVKVLNSDFRNHPDAFISLQREASRSHILSHPNIVTVHDFDRDGNTIFMTMELLAGEDLDTLLKKHKGVGLPKERALKILSEFCQALVFAHEKGIIHSDLKPANIFITDDQAKVLDFGIARLASESKYQDHFDAGTIRALTPEYASLEMLANQPPHMSDDVYAAAIITYELLTGTHPYQRKTAAAAQSMGLKPKRIPGLSRRQWRALSQALALKRSERTQSIDAFNQALTVKPRLPVFKVASFLLLSILFWFAYSQYFVPDELTRFIDQSMNKAQNCYHTEDFQCAIDSSLDILKVEPNHVSAVNLLARAQKAQLAFVQQQQIDEALSAAELCVSQKNFNCVLEQTRRVLAIDRHHVLALALADKADKAIVAEQQRILQIDKAYTENMQKATRCFEAKDYLCSQKYATLASENKPDDTSAKSLLENSGYALRQQQENLKKADKILLDGLRCFKKLDYSCAIAKSESALEFVPGHRAALKLKLDASDALANVKETIEIQ
ncbi:serine/threonine protein kinase [Aliikangiella maris]|uniref:Serine/threonine-protein kinase n=2 Tax=Aliikangiella maris TaxID=3162458 RepID=A0ABV3MP97_9GAMM